MTYHCLRLVCVVAGIGAASHAIAKTSLIRCRSPHGAVATTICASPEYRAMEREIAALTDRGMAELSPGDRSRLDESQARFLRQRQGCEWAAHNSAHPGTAVDECVRASLEGRVQRLRILIERASF